MTDKKLTDNEIKKALEELRENQEDGYVTALEYGGKRDIEHEEFLYLIANTLDLINRLQAENERLEYLLAFEEEKYTKCAKQFYKEGAKQFAERLKEKAYTYSDITGYQSTVVDVCEIDGVYEELVGEENV